MVILSGLSSPLRTMVKTMSVPGCPRILSTASFSDIPFTGVSSRRIIKSPALIPARSAGVSSIGEMTLTKPSSMPTSIPRPPNSPVVPSCRSAYDSLVQVRGMWVQSAKHPTNGIFKKFTIINRFNIVIFDFGKDFSKCT